ncbi:hypothetical protein MNBD_GAMMA05-349 [hydrothermal vent metagenome]|uniref:Histidine kinase/HSP90-like ATPase domain-containing protein n=1 Tax=hydrothermal vent metagenome TaxID=652676 RepID=A0A3B0XBN5_9ZZZZ
MNKQKIIIDNSSADSDALTKFIGSYTSAQNIPEILLKDLRLVSEEIFINIVNYAYPENETHKITIELWHTENSINITFIDTGRAFNPLVGCTPSIETDDHCEGGMGIHLIKSLTDNQKYNRINERNIFTITKHYTIQNITKE